MSAMKMEIHIQAKFFFKILLHVSVKILLLYFFFTVRYILLNKFFHLLLWNYLKYLLSQWKNAFNSSLLCFTDLPKIQKNRQVLCWCPGYGICYSMCFMSLTNGEDSVCQSEQKLFKGITCHKLVTDVDNTIIIQRQCEMSAMETSQSGENISEFFHLQM